MGKVTIYHNPNCSKSRQTLQLLRDRGVEPTIVEYLKETPDERTLSRLIQKLGIEAEDLIRKKEYRQLGLSETEDPDELVKRMVKHPEIIERPIVETGSKAILGRPPENVLEILS
jgi:arsenate reductase